MPLTVTRRDGIFFILSAIMVTIFVVSAGGWGFPLDDSWIHQTYGRNLALHGEWAFILGEPSAASTSPLYTLVLAVGYLFRIPYMLWAHLIGIFALTITATLGARMTSYVLPNSKWAGWWVGLALIFTWHLIWAAASGMETMLFSMMTFVLIYLAFRETDEQRQQTKQSLILRGSVLGIATALAALARPEGAMLGGIIALLMVIVKPQGNLKNVIIYGTGAAIGFAITISPYLWLNLQLTGGILPNTANAKFEQHAILLELPYLVRYQNLAFTIFAGGQFLLIPGILAYIWQKITDENRLRNLYFLLPVFWGLAHIAVYASRLPATYQHGRYVMPALPSLIFAGVIGTFWLIQIQKKTKASNFTSTLSRILIQVLAISAIAVTLAFLPTGIQAYSNDVAVINSEMVASAEYIRENIPQDDLMAIHDIGAVGYFAPRDMIDIAGLVTPEIIPIVSDGDALWEYMEANGAQYLMAFPDQIPNDDPNDPRLCLIFTTDSDITRQLRGASGQSMAIYRLAYDATCAS